MLESAREKYRRKHLLYVGLVPLRPTVKGTIDTNSLEFTLARYRLSVDVKNQQKIAIVLLADLTESITGAKHD